MFPANVNGTPGCSGLALSVAGAEKCPELRKSPHPYNTTIIGGFAAHFLSRFLNDVHPQSSSRPSRCPTPSQGLSSRSFPVKPTRIKSIESAMAARVLLQRVSPSQLKLELPSKPPLHERFANTIPNQRAVPLTAALLVGGVAFYPRIAHAEAPEGRLLVR
jgi:hypothetical protein